MGEKQKKAIKQILTAIAIIFTIIMLYFAASQFLLNEKDDSIELKFYEYRIAEDEIVVTPETYTQEGVTVEITTQKAGLSIQYNLEGTTEWLDYTGPFIVEENVKLNARLVSAVDYFEGPITSKNIKNISVAKIGDKYYKTLAEAIAACPENISDSQIKIEMLTNTSENVVIPEGKNIQLDLCGATLTSASAETEEDSGTGEGSGESTQAEATIIVNGKLNLIDSAQNEDGTLQGNGKVESNMSAAIKVTDAGTLTLGTNEAEISVDKTNPVVVGVNCGVVIEEGGKFNFYDGKIQGVEGNSIIGNVSDIPDAYCVDKTTADGVETATLGEVNYEVSGGATLADVVQVGDYVNYDASSNGTKTFTSSDCLTGTSVSATISTDDNFNSDAVAQWRVLSVDKTTGVVELMAADPTAQTVTLSGGDGFVNAETVLNKVGAIYGQGKGATGGRSITVEDVEQYSSYVPTIGSTITYTSGNFYKELKDEQGNVTGYEDTTTAASSSNPVTMTQTYYNYTASSYFSNSAIYNMIFKNSTSISSNKSNYWLASRCVYLFTSYCDLGVRNVNTGRVNYYHVYNSSGSANSPASMVVPVVSLKSNILTTGQDESGVWQLKFEETTPVVNYYSTLQSAINNAPAGSTIKALNGIEETKAPTVPTEKGLVLDLNGKTTTLKGVSLTNNGGLTITGEGKITSANANTIVNTGRLKKSGNGTIENTGATTVAINNTGMVNILEGTVIAKLNAINTTSGIVTLGVNDETVSINNPTITATDTGISIGEGKFNFYDGAVKGTNGKSIVGTITDMATNHGVIKTISDEVETSILKRKIKVTFDANGGTASFTSKDVLSDMAYGSLPTVEEREGYSFLGWRNANNQISTNVDDWESGAIDIAGNLSGNNSRLRLKDYLKVSPNTQYILTTNTSELITPRVILLYDKNYNLVKSYDGWSISEGSKHNVVFITLENCEYIKVTLIKGNSTEGAPISVEDITKANIELYATITENTKVIEENNHTLKALWSEIVASTTINGVTTIYDSVQGAIDAAGTNEGARVTLLKNEIVESVTVAAGQDIVLDTNGKTLTSDTNTLTNYGNLVIDGGGTITTTVLKETILNKEEGNLYVINGNVYALDTYSTAISSTSANDIIIGTENDDSIEMPHIKGMLRSDNDGDIYVHSGLIEGTTWRALQGKKNIVVTGGKITVSGTMEHTYAIISTAADSVIDISGGIIESGKNLAITTTTSLGGKILISGGEIYSENERAVLNQIGETEITGGTIKGEKGVYISTGTLTITGGTINATTVGIVVTRGEVTVTGGTITGSTYGIMCSDSGKVVIGTDDGTVGVDSPLITGTSTADNEGFALHLVDAADCSFFDGKLIGKANSSIYGTVDVVPDGYEIYKSAQTIDGVEREVAYLEKPIYLADVVEVGDYVNIDETASQMTTFSLRPQTNTTQVQENNESDVQNESIEPETSIEQENIEQTQPTPLAQIAETTYETLQSAINASNSEDEITILQDIALTEELTIPENKNIKLNLNNKTISSSSENVIKNNGTLTITKSGIIRNETSNGTVIYNTGTLNIENAIITTAQNGGKAVFNDSGIVNMISGKIVTEGISGIGIYNVNTGKVLIEDGIIEVTGTSSKCIYNDASLEITGGKIVVSGDDSIGIYNSDKSTKCIMNEVEILVEAEVIENYELIKNTQEFKAELEQMKPSYGIYNNSEINVEIETATIKVERLKGVGILNKLEGSVTLGIEDSEVSTATPIVYAISDNTTAIENSEDGNINFYDGRLSTLSSIKDVITKVLDGYELVEEIGENVVNATLKVIEVTQAVENTEAEGIDEQGEQMETTEVTEGAEATEGSEGTEGTEGTEITEGAEGSEVTEGTDVTEGN